MINNQEKKWIQLYAPNRKSWSKWLSVNSVIDFKCCKCGVVHRLQIKPDFKLQTLLMRVKYAK